MTAMDIDNPIRIQALLLHYGGPDLDEIHDTLTIEEPDEDHDTYVRSKEALTAYFTPKKNTAFEIYTFRQAVQLDGEKIDTFVTRLRKLSKSCDFTEPDKEIANQVIFSCSSQPLRRRALRDDLALDELVKLARSLEISEIQAAKVETSNHSSVYAVTDRQQQSPHRRNRSNTRGRPMSRGNNHRRARSQSKPRVKSGLCDYCGYQASHSRCPARGKTCSACYKIGHFSSVCRSSRRQSGHNHRKEAPSHQSANRIDLQDNDSDKDYVFTAHEVPYPSENILSTKTPTSTLPTRSVNIANTTIKMTIDTGASVNIIDSDTYEKLNLKLEPPTSLIYPYASKTPLPVLGVATVPMSFKNRHTSARLHIVHGKGGNLLSFQTAEDLGILSLAQNVNEESKPPVDQYTQQIYDKYPDLFDGIGKFRNKVVTLHIDETVQPKQQPHRRIPFHIRKDVEKELKRLEDLDIIEKAEGPTPWVSPLVVVPKKSGIRLCLDMREANKAVKRVKHLMPTIDELITDLNGSTVFSTLDLASGYHQLELDPNSRYITTFSSHVALYRYKRLIFGINAASEIFQNAVEETIRDIPGVKNISDDIVVHGKNQAEHDKRLHMALDRLRQVGARLNKNKCKLSQPSVTFYGHIFSSKGVRADPQKVEAITKSSPPTNVSELRSFLGMAQYVARFIPNFATITTPLRLLTRQDVTWQWEDSHTEAFNNLKHALSSSQTMTYFDPHKESDLLVDASPSGLGAILTQDGKIVSYASKALTDVEQRYSQTEREMLAAVWGTEHFHLYLYGSAFTIHTDHKPLIGIFKSQRPATARIERWRLRLTPYNFELKYRPGKDDQNPADYLSRHPASLSPQMTDKAEDFVNYICKNAVPKAMTFEQVVSETKNDATLQAVMTSIQTNKWEQPMVHSFKKVRHELSICADIILRGSRIVLPSSLHAQAISLAHAGHQGIVKTKQLLREKVWFPNLDSLAEQTIKQCLPCQASSSHSCPPEPLRPRQLPGGPWQDISVDFLGPLPSNDMLLVAIDNYSRFPEVEIISSTAAKVVIPKLDAIFARHGIPETVYSDNGPPFNSEDFAMFAKHLGFRHRPVTPLWPQANGEAEHFMSPLMKSIRAAHIEQRSWKQEFNTFLRQYRATPHATTSVSPAEALYNRPIRTTLPSRSLPPVASRNVHKTIKTTDELRKAKAKAYYDSSKNAKASPLSVGDTVLVKQRRTNKLSTPFDPQPLIITARKGSMVTASRGRYSITRNVSFFKSFPRRPEENTIEWDEPISRPPQNPPALIPCLARPESRDRPQRPRRPPVRFKDYVCVCTYT